ncbi:siderophore ABC transporter substrate-binding protein [Empedobacter brevis]
MKNWIKISLLTGIAFLSSCNKENKTDTIDTENQIEVIHKLDTTNVVKNPQRVVVFDMGALESLKELGVKPAGIPKDHIPEHLKVLGNDPSIEDVGSLVEPNLERINALNPDLIIISDRQNKFYDELSKIAPTISMQVDPLDYMNSFEKNTLTLGKIFGKEEEMKKEVEAIKTEVKTDKENIDKIDKKGLIILYNNGKFSAYGKNSRFGFIHDVMGIKPVSENLEVAVHGQPVSNEFIESVNPDYLFVVDRSAMMNKVQTNKNDIENVLIKQTNAYKNGKIIYLNPQVWYISGGGITSTKQMIEDIKKAIQ